MVTSIQHSFLTVAILFGVDSKVNEQVHLMCLNCKKLSLPIVARMVEKS